MVVRVAKARAAVGAGRDPGRPRSAASIAWPVVGRILQVVVLVTGFSHRAFVHDAPRAGDRRRLHAAAADHSAGDAPRASVAALEAAPPRWVKRPERTAERADPPAELAARGRGRGVQPAAGVGAGLGFGRIAVSGIEAPNILVNMV